MKTEVFFLIGIITLGFSTILFSQWSHYTPALTSTKNLTSISFVDANTGWIVGDSGLVYKTTNAGTNWFSQSLSVGYDTFWDVFAVSHDTVWVCGNAGRIYKSVNGGNNWVQQISPVSEYLYKMFFTSNSVGWIVTHLSKILQTTNSGANWNVQYNSSLGVEINMIFAPSKDTIIAGGQGGIVYRTTNGGINWTYSQPALQWMTNMYFINRATGWACGRSGALIKTTNAGVSWSTLNSGTTLQINTVFFANATTGFYAGNQAMIKKTTNGGTSWYDNANLTGSFFLYTLFFHDPLLGWAVGSNGTLLKTTTGGLVFSEQQGNTIPDKYALYTNYPNPFNPVTKIKFDLPKTTQTLLVIYDNTGKEIAEPVNRELTAGVYEITWDASKFASGVYFYKIITPDFTKVMKMVLIK